MYPEVRWVCNQIVDCFGFDDYNIIPVLAYWPGHGRLPQPWKANCKRLTRALVQEASLVVICGGNGMALLDSFETCPDIRSDLALHVRTNRNVLLGWSAGATCSGVSAEQSNDRGRHLRLSTGLPPCLAGLGLIPGHSFAPHFKLADCRIWHQWIRRIRQINFGTMYFISDDCWVAFDGGSHLYCSSLDEGSDVGVWYWHDQYFFF